MYARLFGNPHPEPRKAPKRKAAKLPDRPKLHKGFLAQPFLPSGFPYGKSDQMPDCEFFHKDKLEFFLIPSPAAIRTVGFDASSAADTPGTTPRTAPLYSQVNAFADRPKKCPIPSK